MDEYHTVATSLSWETKIERSIFIAHVKEVSSEKEAKLFINEITEQHKQATHNCYAYRIGFNKKEHFYYNDDGEPNGTAGKPIYGAILRNEITNVVIVVTRYFGGKKLGIRGLIEAYGETAAAALKKAGIITRIRKKSISFQCGYPQISQVNYLLNKYDAKIVSQEFTEKITSIVLVRERNLKNFLQEIGEYVKNLELS